MESVQSGVVEIVRDFLVAHDLMQRTFERFRAGTLRFEEVHALVGDDEGSALYRLKERCHALFRAEKAQSALTMRREALFDLAVGSLFHEAMKFRENFYQLEVYAPRVQKLERESGDEAGELFEEFGKILAAATERLEESLIETEILLEQTSRQLRVLLIDQRENGLISRYLVDKRSLVDRAFRSGLDGLLTDVYGGAGQGYAHAARSYLASAHFGPALAALAEARSRDPERHDLARLESYALGMQAFLTGDYGPCLLHLAAWLEARPNDEESGFLTLARAAVVHIASLERSSEESDGIPNAIVVRKRIEDLLALSR
jgi:tetratricopeptide (TPR) repeat protein